MRPAIPQDGTNTYLIPLTKGHYAIIDACDIELAAVNWTAAVDKRRSLVYARRITYDRGLVISRDWLHRKVMERILGRQLSKSEMVDHANGNGLDCRRSNIRLATTVQNGGNKKLFSNSTSGYKGVSWDKKSRKWRAKIYPNGRQIQLGLFDDPIDAHNAYKDAAKFYFGEFANDGSGGIE